MKILCVIQRYYPVIGGAENLMKDLMDYLSKNHEVTVYTTTAKEIESFWDRNAERITEKIDYKYPIKRFEVVTPVQLKHGKDLEMFYYASSHPGPFSPSLWTELVTKKIDFDLIITASFPYDHVLPAYAASKKWNIPIIIYPMIHQEFIELFLNSIKLTLLENSNAIVVNTLSEKKILIELGIKNPKIFHNIPITKKIDTDDLDPEGFKNDIGLRGNSKFVLFVGSKSRVKGIMFLINSMKKVWKKNPKIKLVLMGPPTKEFEEFFKELDEDIKNKIIDLGIANEKTKKNAYAACDIFALPSISESFGMVYVEAWSFGKPVIGCNITSTSEIIEDHKNGLLVSFEKLDELSNAINYLVENSSIAQKYGLEGKKKAEFFTSTDNLKNFEEICITTVNSFKNKQLQ